MSPVLTAAGTAVLLFQAVSALAADNQVHQEVSQYMNRADIEHALRQRADAYLSERYVVVDYYRIRRKLAYALPVSRRPEPAIQAPTIDNYPWATWFLWELEERVNCLGWAAEWFGDQTAAEAAARDLAALAEWPEYRQYPGPDLCAGHSGRLLWTAYTKWHWLDDALREKIKAACARHAAQVLAASDTFHGAFATKEDLLALPEPHEKLPNIPLIGTVGGALTASVAGLPCAAVLNARIQAIFGAILELRGEGLTEGVGYDGYVLDFVADWLEVLPPEERDALLAHPRLQDYLDESYMLAAPGTAVQVAQLSDVEPREMPFHLCAQAKLFAFAPDPVRAWHLKRCRVDWMPAPGLAALREAIDGLGGDAPAAGALNAHYALVLRSGWEAGDLAAAMSCTASPMSHIQQDNGTLLVGTQGRWFITDPGYQQYMQDDERVFTLGPAAHNFPVINGLAQDKKAPRLIALENVGERVHRACVDLTACYPAGAKASSVVRTVWLVGANLVVAGDEVKAEGVERLTYHWHGDADAAWGERDGWMLVHLPEADLWLRSPQAPASEANLQRLAGSRGQLTLVAEADVAAPIVWWVFVVGDAPPEVAGEGRSIEVMGQRFSLETRVE